MVEVAVDAVIQDMSGDGRSHGRKGYDTNLRMTKIPPPSGPRVFSTGALALSKVMYAVPAVEE